MERKCCLILTATCACKGATIGAGPPASRLAAPAIVSDSAARASLTEDGQAQDDQAEDDQAR